MKSSSRTTVSPLPFSVVKRGCLASAALDSADFLAPIPGILLGVLNQVRLLGGAIGVAVGQAVINAKLKSDVGSTLGSKALDGILHSTAPMKGLSAEQGIFIRAVYGKAFETHTWILVGFAAASLITTFGVWKRHFESGLEIENQRKAARLTLPAELRGRCLVRVV